MNRAAAVLVFNGPRVLAFRRYDSAGLSLPCGKIEDNESLHEAALREGKEETGLDLRIVDYSPFCGFDVVGGAFVTTFLAEPVGGHLIASAPGEGEPLWASLLEIASGPYWHYNVRALRHFGHRPPLRGKFHSHLTIDAMSQSEAERAALLVGGKLTTIDLERKDRSQRDVMITHHYVTGSRGLEDQYDVTARLRSMATQLRESGFKVLRAKLEYDLLHDRSDRALVTAALDNIYTEVHIKCVVPEERRAALVELAAHRGWHPSRNPFDRKADGRLVQFVNRRFYDESTTLAAIDESVDGLLRHVVTIAEVAEVKYETAVYDTAEQHDRWWMEQGQ